MTDPSQTSASEMDRCNLEIDRKYEVVPAVISSVCCLFGIIYCFFGYRCFKAVMFLSGLMFGSVVIFLLCYRERVLDTQLSVEASAGIGLGIGLLCGLVTMLVRSVGLFMTGLLLGLLLAIAALLAASPFYIPSSLWVPLGALLGSGMLCAVLSLQWQKVFTVLSTSVFGAAVMTVCVDYFVEMLVLVTYIYNCLRLEPVSPPCWYSWVILGIWPALSLLGVLVQWKLTAEGFSHTEVVINRRRKQAQLMRIHQKEAKSREEGGTQDGSYQRKPTPVKRYAGDLLAPVRPSLPSNIPYCSAGVVILISMSEPIWVLGLGHPSEEMFSRSGTHAVLPFSMDSSASLSPESHRSRFCLSNIKIVEKDQNRLK